VNDKGIKLWAWGEICGHLSINPEAFRLAVAAAKVTPYFTLSGVDYFTEADEAKMFIVLRSLPAKPDHSEVTR
jgi:hypothetical protein